ncbi:unnamed protein product [Plutella xylostella]|uniref:(diamondback moth) hypothetical protein n=1 Tax=Plutella xylostella TaxID=51655 RepID=A0A8S4FWS2_PLUXY|nr:unnamed protein product [Plutella xylostella]
MEGEGEGREGGILAVPAAVNESTFLLLSTAEVDAPSDVHDVSEARRGCKFGKPGETYIQCLTECRRKTIETLCGCVPFQYMPAAGDTLCRLEQLPCLNKYREKLLFYFPKDTDFDPGLQEEFSDSLDCYFCLPDCTRTRYKRRVVNSSIVRLFYSTEGQTLYSLEVTERWYELTSIIGGQCCMIFGITIMLGPEIIYYLTIRWKHHFDILKRRQAI